MRNIGHALVRIGQYADAVTSYEHILDSTPIQVSGMNEQGRPLTEHCVGPRGNRASDSREGLRGCIQHNTLLLCHG